MYEPYRKYCWRWIISWIRIIFTVITGVPYTSHIHFILHINVWFNTLSMFTVWLNWCTYVSVYRNTRRFTAEKKKSNTRKVLEIRVCVVLSPLRNKKEKQIFFYWIFQDQANFSVEKETNKCLTLCLSIGWKEKILCSKLWVYRRAIFMKIRKRSPIWIDCYKWFSQSNNSDRTVSISI